MLAITWMLLTIAAAMLAGCERKDGTELKARFNQEILLIGMLTNGNGLSICEECWCLMGGGGFYCEGIFSYVF